MVIGDVIIKKGDVVDVLPYISLGNNVLAGTGWVNKSEKCNNELTAMSVKLDVYGLLYHTIPLKYATEFDNLKIMYSDPQKNRFFCDNIINKETRKKSYK